MHFHFRRSAFVDIPLPVHKPHADDLPKSLATHRASVHSQRPADLARNALEPLEPADACVARSICQFLLLHACTGGDAHSHPPKSS